MSNAYKLFKTNKDFEADSGVTLDYGDFKIRILRAGGANKKFARILDERLKPHKRQIDSGTFNEDVALSIMIKTFADAVVIGWDGVKDENDQLMDFNKENVIKLFTDLPDLFRDVQKQADTLALFRASEIEDDSKN